MKKNLLLIIIFLLVSFNAHAAIVNGSFEDGLLGFYSYGNGEVEIYETLGDGVIYPTHGSRFLYLSVGPGDVGLDGDSDSSTVESDRFKIGSGILTLTFDFNVLTGQSTPSSWWGDCFCIYFDNKAMAFGSTEDNKMHYRDESGHMQVVTNIFSPLQQDITTSSGAYYTKETGWYHMVIDVSELSGTDFRNWIYFYVAEISGSELFDTALLVDNIQLNPVPVPSTGLLLGSGLIGLVGIARKMLFGVR